MKGMSGKHYKGKTSQGSAPRTRPGYGTDGVGENKPPSGSAAKTVGKHSGYGSKGV